MNVKRVSTPFYLVSILGGGISVLIVITIGWNNAFSPLVQMVVENLQAPPSAEEFMPALATMARYAFYALLAGLYPLIVRMVLLFKAWDAIQDDNSGTSPGMAVGLLFVPLFNLYWIFRAYGLYAQEYNNYLRRQCLDVKPRSHGLFLTYPIIVVCGIPPIPVVHLVLALATIVYKYLLLPIQFCGAINALADAPPLMEATDLGGEDDGGGPWEPVQQV